MQSCLLHAPSPSVGILAQWSLCQDSGWTTTLQSTVVQRLGTTWKYTNLDNIEGKLSDHLVFVTGSIFPEFQIGVLPNSTRDHEGWIWTLHASSLWSYVLWDTVFLSPHPASRRNSMVTRKKVRKKQAFLLRFQELSVLHQEIAHFFAHSWG